VGRPRSLTPGRDGRLVTLRTARDDDIALIQEWRNDADAVRVSATARPVSNVEHARWFATVLSDPDRHLWIAEDHGVPVGQVRVDIDGDAGVFSIAVAPGKRGRGIGQAMLRGALTEVVRERLATRVTALAREDNAASIRAFEQVGFTRRGLTDDGFVVLELALG
jgi:UDP-2,4-diacetamido-2,4,6-trideoxy-beta-L-altropyranose hydrolase